MEIGDGSVSCNTHDRGHCSLSTTSVLAIARHFGVDDDHQTNSLCSVSQERCKTLSDRLLLKQAGLPVKGSKDELRDELLAIRLLMKLRLSTVSCYRLGPCSLGQWIWNDRGGA